MLDFPCWSKLDPKLKVHHHTTLPSRSCSAYRRSARKSSRRTWPALRGAGAAGCRAPRRLPPPSELTTPRITPSSPFSSAEYDDDASSLCSGAGAGAGAAAASARARRRRRWNAETSSPTALARVLTVFTRVPPPTAASPEFRSSASRHESARSSTGLMPAAPFMWTTVAMRDCAHVEMFRDVTCQGMRNGCQ
jgi:hypothetical protein